MVIGCCTNCKYIDLIDDRTENTCLRCSGIMVSLGLNSDEWNKLSSEEMRSLINNVISEIASKNSGADETSSSPKESALDIPNLAHDLPAIPQIDEISTSCASDDSEWSYQLKPDEPDKSYEPATPLLKWEIVFRLTNVKNKTCICRSCFAPNSIKWGNLMWNLSSLRLQNHNTKGIYMPKELETLDKLEAVGIILTAIGATGDWIEGFE